MDEAELPEEEGAICSCCCFFVDVCFLEVTLLRGGDAAPARRTAATYCVCNDRRWMIARSDASFTPIIGNESMQLQMIS